MNELSLENLNIFSNKLSFISDGILTIAAEIEASKTNADYADKLNILGNKLVLFADIIAAYVAVEQGSSSLQSSNLIEREATVANINSSYAYVVGDILAVKAAVLQSTIKE